MKFLRQITLCILLAISLNSANGANNWTGAASDDLWTNSENWSEGFPPPNSTNHPAFGWDDPSQPFYPLTPDTEDDYPLFSNAAHLSANGTTTLIDDSVTNAAAYGLYVGFDGANNLLKMTGGFLSVGEWHLDIGRGFNRFNNPTPTARMIMTGGQIDTALVKIPEQFVDGSHDNPYDTAPIRGEFTMTGGLLNARKINVGQFVGDGSATFSGNAVVNLIPNVPGDPGNGGHLEMKQNWYIAGQPVETVSDAHIDISENAIINIFGHINGMLTTPDVSEVARYQAYINDQWLTADNRTDRPTVYLANDQIKICALDADFGSDCDVDQDDLAALHTGFSLLNGASKLDGDTDNDGDVDGADFLEWQREYGVGIDLVVPTATVPEPATIWLFSVGIMMILKRR